MNVRTLAALAICLAILFSCTREPPPCEKDPPPYLKGTIHDCAMREPKVDEHHEGRP